MARFVCPVAFCAIVLSACSGATTAQKPAATGSTPQATSVAGPSWILEAGKPDCHKRAFQ
jgi:hypothetical protein